MSLDFRLRSMTIDESTFRVWQEATDTATKQRWHVIDQFVKAKIRPKPWWLPRKLWWALVSRLLVVETMDVAKRRR